LLPTLPAGTSARATTYGRGCRCLPSDSGHLYSLVKYRRFRVTAERVRAAARPSRGGPSRRRSSGSPRPWPTVRGAPGSCTQRG